MGSQICSRSQIHVSEDKTIPHDTNQNETIADCQKDSDFQSQKEENVQLFHFLNSKFTASNPATKKIVFQLAKTVDFIKENSNSIASGSIQNEEEISFNKSEVKLITFDPANSLEQNHGEKPKDSGHDSQKSSIKKSRHAFTQKVISPFENETSTFKRLNIKQSSFVRLKSSTTFQGSYQILQKIGEGSNGTVHKVLCRKSNTIRVVKILKTRALKRLNGTKKLHCELNILRSLDHPNIIKVYDVFFTEEFYYVVTEYCSGGTLFDYALKNSNIDEKIIKIIMKQLFGALSYLHEQSIIHRDIKLENIVFNTDPSLCTNFNEIEIKIIDFGLAMKAKFKTINKDDPNMGTPYYMAPEILKGIYSDKCDIWSCGIILHFMLFKDYPYTGEDIPSIYQKIENSDIDFTKPYWKRATELQKQILSCLLERNFFKRKSAHQVSMSKWLEEAYDSWGKDQRQLVWRKINEYKKQNNFVRFIESYLVFLQNNNEQQRALVTLFHKFDTNCNGAIDLNELKQICEENETRDEAQMIEMLSKIDKNNSGKIEISEFLAFLSDRNKLFTEANLEVAFDFLDENKNGYIEKIELKKALEGCDKEEYKFLWKDIDKNQDNKISKEEFMDYLQKMIDVSSFEQNSRE